MGSASPKDLSTSLTCSAWVSNSGDATLLWKCWFCGKGDLSKNEPRYLLRYKCDLMKGKGLTSEEIIAKRCAECKQFKFYRVKSTVAAMEAESQIQKVWCLYFTSFLQRKRQCTPVSEGNAGQVKD
ncbi:hypothetical protein EV424DRAFT_1343163 [Suillus variegatus]|nr:hypothetical protein EV424DRAFT_1343163 [Suillus variegatus]